MLTRWAVTLSDLQESFTGVPEAQSIKRNLYGEHARLLSRLYNLGRCFSSHDRKSKPAVMNFQFGNRLTALILILFVDEGSAVVTSHCHRRKKLKPEIGGSMHVTGLK